MFDNKELTKSKYLSFMEASFNHKPSISQSVHFFVSFWIFGNLLQIQVRIIKKITKQIHVVFSFYILHLAYTFVMLSYKLASLLVHSVIFSTIKRSSPKSNERHNVNYQRRHNCHPFQSSLSLSDPSVPHFVFAQSLKPSFHVLSRYFLFHYKAKIGGGYHC